MAYETKEITWKGQVIEIALDAEHFKSANMAHIEIRCEEALPITETGYQSIFISSEEVPDINIAVDMILQTLEEAAMKIKWVSNKQLSLF